MKTQFSIDPDSGLPDFEMGGLYDIPTYMMESYNEKKVEFDRVRRMLVKWVKECSPLLIDSDTMLEAELLASEMNAEFGWPGDEVKV
jgi:hypothetical protein